MLKQWIKTNAPINVYGTVPEEVTGITTDSREVVKGGMFIAIKGTAADGHIFISKAIEQGASVVIFEDSSAVNPADFPEVCFIETQNSRLAASSLALTFYDHPEQKLTLIGVTGTNGKTTISTLIWQLLDRLDVKAGLLGTVAKRIGKEVVPSMLTTPGPIELAADLAQMAEAGCTHAVMEVSSHALAQHRADGLTLTVSIFTNLSHDHLDYHPNLDDYATAKAKLFELTSKEGHSIINMDDERGPFMAEHAEGTVIPVSFKSGKDFVIEENSSNGLILSIKGKTLKSPLVGRFNAYNLAQAFLTLSALGFDEDELLPHFEEMNGANGRLENIIIDSDINLPRVFVDYAHTPDALENVSETLFNIKKEDEVLVIVFGCGGDRDKTKRPMMAEIAEKFGDEIYLTSDNPRFEHPEDIIDDVAAGLSKNATFKRVPDRRKAIRHSISDHSEKAIILVAGKGHETYQEVKGVRYPMDDRITAREALKEKESFIKNQTEEN